MLLIFLSDGNVESAAGEMKWHVDDWLVEIDLVCAGVGGGAGMLGEEEPEIDAAEAGRGVEPRCDRSPLHFSLQPATLTALVSIDSVWIPQHLFLVTPCKDTLSGTDFL